MSSVSSLSSRSDSPLSQILQRLAINHTGKSSGSSETGRLAQLPDEDREAGFESTMSQALKNLGVSDSEIASVEADIRAGLAAAQRTADGSGQRDTITNAIDAALAKHSLDPSQVQKEFQSIAGPPQGRSSQYSRVQGGKPSGGPPPGHHPPDAGGPGGAGKSDSSSTSNTTSDTDGTQTLTELIQELLESGNLDSSTSQILKGFLPSVDASA